MGKKKLSLKPVNRGFATTSVQSKKQKEEAAALAEQQAAEAAEKALAEEAARTAATTTDSEQPVTGSGASDDTAEDWEREDVADEGILQGLVDRLQEKGDKEVARIIKAIEYDKRIAAGYTSLNLDHSIRDQILALVQAEDDHAPNEDASVEGPSSSILRASSTSEQDKTLLRLFITYSVLAQLGFSEARITQCIVSGLREGEGWEEALEWMWLHLSEDECLQRGVYAPKEEVLQFDEPLAASSNAPAPVLDANLDTPPPKSAPTDRPAISTNDPVPVSLFQSAALSDESDSSSDAGDIDAEADVCSRKWADLMLKLDSLRLAAGGGSKAKGNKKKGTGVVLETPEMREVMAKMKVIEKEYMFNRKDADVMFKSLKAKRDAEAIEAKLRFKEVERFHKPSESGSSTPVDALAEAGSDDEGGGLFGNLLDESEPSSSLTSDVPENTSIRVRSMPIPKQTAYSGTTPKATLKSLVTKAFKSAVILYASLSGGSRAARAGVEIRFNAKRRSVTKMEDIACDDMAQAENYVSTLVLHDLQMRGDIPQVTWRTFPPAYRDLWEELDVQWKEKEDGKRREIWRKLRGMYDKKAVATSEANGMTVATSATSDAIANGSAKAKVDYIERLQHDFHRRIATPAYQKMRPQRDGLPIASFRQQILDTIDRNQVMVLSGETGCGKSTQLPAYILEDQMAKGKPCKIYVTEPRRISAISLAQRVSAELGDAPGQMGTSSSLVGYSIRLEAKVSAQTRLAFVTNGIALRMLEAGSAPGKATAFDEVTHIVVDEVHERSIDSDFLLIVLRSLMQQRPDLKVILMSATLDADKISNYFGGCPYLAVPGRTFPVQVNYLEDAVQAADWHIDESSHYAVRHRHVKGGKQLEWTEDTPQNSDSEDEKEQDPTKLSAAKYSPKTVSTVNLLDSRQIPYDLIVRLLERICFEDGQYKPFSAATLVFMPGLAEIRKLNDMLLGHPAFGSQDFMVYPLHSTVSSEGQQAVFDIPPPGIRKIVISTNIAETGVTIPDITCVIDSGKHREMRYDEKRQISRLVETYIAKSNAKQRRGRAGRVQEGLAFHLFTKARHDAQAGPLADHPIPEMLRLSLQDLALRIKILRLNLGSSVEAVLLQALDPPTSLNIQRAIASLVEVKALTLGEEITPMGRLLSKLPMDVHLGKFLLVAAMMKCLDPALTIAATLNGKSPFVTPFGMEGAADTAKKGFSADHSDFMTIVNAFNAWRRASDNPSNIRAFCRKNFLSHQQIEELRQQLLAYLVDSGFINVTPEQQREISQARYSRGFKTRFVTVPADTNINAENSEIISASLAAGLYPKILSIDPSGGMKTLINQQPVAIHPTSVNFRKRPAQFEANYLTYFTIMQSKRLYAWEVAPVDDKALAVLCGDIVDFKPAAGSLVLDRKIRYSLLSKSGIAIKLLRQHFAQALNTRLRGKKWSEQQEAWFELGVRCLSAANDLDEEQVGIVGL